MNPKDDPTKEFSRRGRAPQKDVKPISSMGESRLQPGPDHPIRDIELFAWLGADELGSGEIGLKQARMPVGRIPLVAVKLFKMNSAAIVDAMRMEAEVYGKKIRLCRFVFAEVLFETPAGEDEP
jgi:hypothetical protein